MQITLNGSPHDCPSPSTISQLLQQAGYGGKRVAVEVNLEIIPRGQHDAHQLAEGDRVEIVQAIGGG